MAVEPRSSRHALAWQMATYAVLSVLAWLTLPDWRIRGAVWVVMGGLAVKTWVNYKRGNIPD